MPKQSAGILMYRYRNDEIQVFLVHPGGPFWAKKDDGAWSIPKGEYSADEDALETAKREFEEETGFTLQGKFQELPEIKQKGGKLVKAWVVKGDCDPQKIRSNTFKMKWPPRSGREQEFPEIDKAEWFSLATARQKILKSQAPLLDLLEEMLMRDK
ncbi:MAG: NUDIX domain-containing protein [Calditrichae bacterium]|nr:NUDIX domain-containing protein [Calditrichia bacterium]NIW78180.1 NUDIX domain-containing protein [Calditrichia bacterium]